MGYTFVQIINLNLVIKLIKMSKIKGINNNDMKPQMEEELEPLKDEKCTDFEQILNLVGGEGKYQNIVLYVILCPIVTVAPFLILNTIFMWDTPEHWCHVPGRRENVSIEAWKNSTLPWETGPDGQLRYSQCKMFDLNGNATECLNGWEYDTTDYSATVPSEFNWVCENDQRATECFTMGNIGSAIGTVIFGVMADKYGRKPVFFLTCLTSLVFKSISLFIPQYFTLYKICQLFGGFAYPAVFTMPSLIAAEVCGTDYRSWVYAVTWMIWVVGNSIIPFVAMVARNWFTFGWIAAAPGFFLFLYIFIMDESPRWQITVGKTKPAVKIIMKIAKTNGRIVEEGKIEKMVEELASKQREETVGKSVNAWALFSRRNLAKNTIILVTALTMNMLLYYGVTLHTTHMAGNKFLNYFFLALIELPGGWLAGKLAEKTGRRWTQVGFFALCTISCIVCAVGVTFPNSTLIVIGGALGIKFGVAVASLIVYLQATEIFPTSLRSSGQALGSTVSSVLGVLGPYIVYTSTMHVSLPYIILTLCSFFGLVSAAFLPETYKQSLPETIEEANNFGKDQKFWSFLPQGNKPVELGLKDGKRESQY